MTRKGWALVIIIAGLIVVFGGNWAANHGYIPGKKIMQSIIPQKANIVSTNEVKDIQTKATISQAPLPSSSVLGTGKEVRGLVMAWNACLSWLLSNGGPVTTQDSLQAKHGVTNLHISRQNDTNQMQVEQYKFAKDLKSGDSNPKSGVHFVVIMGDGAPAYLAGLNPKLIKEFGPEYSAEIIGAWGYSRGEDKFMGPMELKNNPDKAKGMVIAGVLRDGDWNIAIKWAGDNGIKNNPDETTYDPDAMNWLAVDDFTIAAQKYVEGYSETRPVVKNGKKTGQKIKITFGTCRQDEKDCVSNVGVVTWTPGDVTVAQKKGGLVSILSTKENYWQMPATIIGIKKWDNDNRDLVENMLAAGFEAGDQVKSYPKALRKGAEISAQVYKEGNADYWEKYYKGTTEMDAKGLKVSLGGSSSNNLADNKYLFGLEGATNIFASVYTVFGNIIVEQYPKLVPSYPPVNEIVNTTYIQGASSKVGTKTMVAEMPKYSGTDIKDVVATKTWTINFKTGSADFTPDTLKTMTDLYNQLSVNSLAVEVHGYTDNVGMRGQTEEQSAESNMNLSQRRADAVKNWLERKSASSFPEKRIHTVAHGQSDSVATNNTEEGRRQNRRVVIVMGTT